MAIHQQPTRQQSRAEMRPGGDDRTSHVRCDKAPMRVVIDGSPLIGPKSGVAAYTASLIRALSLLPDQVTLTVFFDSLRIAPDAILSRHRLPSLSIARFRLPRRLLQLLWRHSLLPITSTAGPSDVVHSTNFAIYPVGHSRQVMMLYDLSIRQHPEWHFPERVREIERHLSRISRADAVLVATDHIARAAVAHLGLAPSRLCKVPLGVEAQFHATGVKRMAPQPIPPEEDEAARIRQRYGLPHAYILFVGTIEPRKNLTTLLEAFAQLPAALRREHPLILAGHPGWRTEPIYAAAADLRAEGTVRFLGGVPDQALPELYAGAVLFVYPSLDEGFGLPPLEAMACGTPVIISDAPALVEVSGPAARVVPRRDPGALTAALTDLLADPAERARLAAAGQRHASQFTWERTAQETLAVYRRVLGRT